MGRQKSNSAKEKLKDQPFRTVTEKKEFVDKIRRETLARLETAKAMEEFTKNPDYAFYKEKFRKGMSCSYGADVDIVHVSLDDDGIKVTISETAKETKNENELKLIGQLVESTSNSLILSYYEAMGYISRHNISSDNSSVNK